MALFDFRPSHVNPKWIVHAPSINALASNNVDQWVSYSYELSHLTLIHTLIEASLESRYGMNRGLRKLSQYQAIHVAFDAAQEAWKVKDEISGSTSDQALQQALIKISQLRRAEDTVIMAAQFLHLSYMTKPDVREQACDVILDRIEQDCFAVLEADKRYAQNPHQGFSLDTRLGGNKAYTYSNQISENFHTSTISPGIKTGVATCVMAHSKAGSFYYNKAKEVVERNMPLLEGHEMMRAAARVITMYDWFSRESLTYKRALHYLSIQKERELISPIRPKIQALFAPVNG